jgi:hypothetical protein
MVANAFFENVSKHRTEGRELREGEKEENVVLEFRPKPTQDMLLACLWSHWTEGEESLLSFAAITDEPPAEVAAAGHDRCVIPIKPETSTPGSIRRTIYRRPIASSMIAGGRTMSIDWLREVRPDRNDDLHLCHCRLRRRYADDCRRRSEVALAD